MEPLPDDHGYRWHGQLNGGVVLEGAEEYLGCRVSGTNVVRTGGTGQECWSGTRSVCRVYGKLAIVLNQPIQGGRIVCGP